MVSSARHAARWVLLALLVPLLPSVALVAATAPAAQAAPPGFTIEDLPFTGLAQPGNVEFAATGQVFVAERRGVIKVFDNLDDATSRQAADLRLRVYNNGDRGLLGMVLDPAYPQRPYLWALYTKDADPGGTVPKYGNATSDTDPCPTDGGANDCRVSAELTRLTLDPVTGAWTGQEAVLLGGGWCQQYGSHTIGTVEFGTDGYLYVGSGDAASYNQVDVGNLGSQRCADVSGWGGALRAQSARQPAGTAVVPHGSILRIDPDTGAPAPGNPFISDPDPMRKRIVAHGMRNPFRFAARPGTSEIWVGDVGWTRFEELNKIVVDGTAENFGWPCYEGSGRQPGYDSADAPACESLYAQGASAVTAPALSYAHGTALGTGCGSGGSSVSAVAFGSQSLAYPASYRSGVFFADYSRRCLWFAQLNGGDVVAGSTTVFDNSMFAAELEAGPGGDLYAVDIATGQVKRIRYNAGGNTPPIAVARANPSSGQTPLVVQLDGSGSADPDAGSSISYAWDLDGDGAFDDSTAVSPSWTYTTGGTFTARLRVTDNLGATDVDTVSITAGSDAPTVVLNSTASTTPWRVGDAITFTASATDPEDGALPAASLSTQLVVKHCPNGSECHEHTQARFDGVGTGSFVGPDHEYPAWLELQATATDSDGLVGTTTLRLDPAVVNLTVQTVPSGLRATVGSEEQTTPFSVPVIQRSVNTVAVASPQTRGGTYEFASWSDGGARSHTVTANASATYTATFTETSAPPAVPGLVGAWSFGDGTGTVARDSSATGANGTLEGGPTWVANGRRGGALSFDGVNDRVSIPDRNAFDLTTSFSLTAWARPSAARTWDQVVLKEQPNGLTYALYASGELAGRPNGSAFIGGDRYVDAPSALALNAWSHLALTYDGATMRLYVNGTQVASRAQTGPVATSSGLLRIGGNAIWGEWFAGLLDEVRIYDRALGAAEVVTDSTSDPGTGGDTVPPTAPTALQATAGPGSVSLSWTASTDDVATPTYEVHRSGVSGFSPSASTLVVTGLTATSYVDTAAAPGTHYYRVVASDGTNASAPSAQAQAVVTADTAAPTVPAGVTAQVSGSTATLTWSASTDDRAVTAYQVQRSGGPGGAVTFSVTAPTTTLVDAGLAGGTYSYEVRARDAAGNWSGWSSPATAQVVVDQAAPTVTVTAPANGATVSGQVALSATATDDVAVVGVQLRVDGVAVGAEDTAAPYTATWSSTTVANGQHAITAVARDASGRTTTSAPVTVTVANAGVPGLVGGWSFDDGTGTTAADSSGRGNTGTLAGGPTWTAQGRYGGALVFDGVNDLVTVPDAASLDLTTGMTLSAWVRPTTLGAWRQVVLKERPSGLTYGLYATGGAGNRPNTTLAIANVEREVNAPAALAAATWTHLAVTYDGAVVRLFVDGTQVATRTQAGSLTTSTGALRIGGNTVWGEWFAGTIDDVRVYDRALTAAEIGTVRGSGL
ncbi:PKD domain-containing protein [Nocardioides sp. zg-1308]|uniref:LamG-like jellyroll fold domain-containing protein n=1 Tax=Nocardioides sp. zg-1308 TaxID=2736253 RepID=UPI001557B9B0|nr:LamG-like jellyroll fold domain-containing protein [Nocardioides sp. zg-1308]NPD04685.1 PKD domain-containing protein [Nocardioides sp. zg-1308]